MALHTLTQLIRGELQGLVSLKISEGLEEFPEEIFELAETLEILDLSGNSLKDLPKDFGRLKKLRIFFCSDNLFTVLPDVLVDCPQLDIAGFKSNLIEMVPSQSLNKNLRWLILTNNKISQIPPSIGCCLRLQKLMLAGNKLSSLPEELVYCQELALLRISANNLSEIPTWIYSLPNLSWVAFSGNNFNLNPSISHVDVIEESHIQLYQKLGEGASGTIYSGIIGKEEVAVKIFKGSVTSDGYPEDEMNAFIGAGNHEGLVKLLGEVNFTADDKKGLVMKMIPSYFYNLGNPPSLVSCTRDVFENDTTLSLVQVFKICMTIASVCEQLHSKGIIHGDLYAHNVLIDHDGTTLFSDFGAASFYDIKNVDQAFYLERIEVKAYGYLLDDLLTLCETSNANGLQQLRDNCLSSNINNRPNFEEIVKELNILNNN